MKNKKYNLVRRSFVLGISLLTGSLQSGVTVFLENNYGAKINVKTSPMQPEGQYVGHNVRVFLGEVNYIPELFIRTTGAGSSYLSSYYSLNHFLTDIKNQQGRHSNDDAIITVGPSSSYSFSWNVSLTWEPKGKGIKPFEYADFPHLIGVPKVNPTIPEPIRVPAHMIHYEDEEALMDLNSADQRLAAIKRGILGEEYGRKATEICSANYTAAEKLGKINLCSELKRNLMAPVYRIDKRAQKKKGFVSPDLAPAIEDIKRSINTLHGALGRYKARGEAS